MKRNNCVTVTDPPPKKKRRKKRRRNLYRAQVRVTVRAAGPESLTVVYLHEQQVNTGVCLTKLITGCLSEGASERPINLSSQGATG